MDTRQAGWVDRYRENSQNGIPGPQWMASAGHVGAPDSKSISRSVRRSHFQLPDRVKQPRWRLGKRTDEDARAGFCCFLFHAMLSGTYWKCIGRPLATFVFPFQVRMCMCYAPIYPRTYVANYVGEVGKVFKIG